MLFGKRDPRPAHARRRGVFRPKSEALETRALMAVIDLGGTSPPVNPAIATTPYGIQFAGAVPSQGAGFSVTDVGDLLGNGYDDYLIGAPSVTTSNGAPVPGGTATSAVYLVFGSRSANSQSISDWLAITNPDMRVGDLNQIGQGGVAQTNPISGKPTFPFDGIKIITSANPTSLLGASVASAGVINGQRAFLIGAPGGLDFSGGTSGAPGNPGTGRAYLIYASTALTSVPNKVLDLDTPASFNGLTIATLGFANGGLTSTRNSQLGYSVAGVGDLYGDNNNEIAIGAPGAVGNSGRVYLLSKVSIPQTTGQFDLTNTGQTGGPSGAIFEGEAPGDAAGFSLAPAFDVNGAFTTANVLIDDFLIGSPQRVNGNASGPGLAYLIYGQTNLTSLTSTSTLVPTQRVISLTQVGKSGSTTSPNVPGYVVQGSVTGNDTGWSVSSGGDFNGDGLPDILIGSPEVDNGGSGEADLIYGQPFSGNPLLGRVVQNAITPFTFATFVGGNLGDMAGLSVGYTGQIRTDEPNPIMIGAPGFNGSHGTAYLIPGNPALLSPPIFNLRNANNQPVASTQFVLTTPTTGFSPAFFGSSVAGALVTSTQAHTADSDTIADLIIGGSGYTATSTRQAAGGASILEGAFVPLQLPSASVATSPIFIDQANTSPFNINATSPTILKIFVDSAVINGLTFNPVIDLNPATITVNGVSFPASSVTITQDPVDENKDGIPDAIVTVTPRSKVGLTNFTTSITLQDILKVTSPFGASAYLGRAIGTVSGGGGGGGGGSSTSGGAAGNAALPGKIIPTSFISHFGPTQYVPTLSQFSADSSYKPIPVKVAVQQYLPQPGFGQRIFNYYYPQKHHHDLGSSKKYYGHRTSTLSQYVFTRSKFRKGVPITFTHEQRVVPTNLQTERIGYYTR
jgi:hypothetical protein